MKSFRVKEVVFTTAVVGIIGAMVLVWDMVAPNSPALYRSLAAFAGGTELGQRADSLDSQLSAFVADHPNINCRRETWNGSLDLVAVETPIQFGARNWILIIALKDGIVKGIGVRTPDSEHLQPIGAPFDRVSSDIREAWKSRFAAIQ